MTTHPHGTPLFGNHVLIATPFDTHGELDEPSLANLVEYVIDGGVDGIIALGTTGEFFTMDAQERAHVITATAHAIRGRVPLTVGVGDSSTRTSIALARHAQAQGASCVMLQPPYYFAHAENAVREHFIQVGRAIDIPVMVYDGAAGIELSLETLEAIMHSAPTVNHAKFSVLNPAKIQRARQRLPNLTILCGDEPMMMLALRNGAQGISVATSNIIPDTITTIYRWYRDGNPDEARRLFHSMVLPTVAACSTGKQEFIRAFKEVLAAKGIIATPTTRPPLMALDPERREEILAVMKAIGVL